MSKVLVAMSGGVDSSVCALILKKSGFDTVGATLKLHQEGREDEDGSCCSLTDIDDARRVCDKLEMDHFVFNYSDLFYDTVVKDFVDEYISGNTPNPCIQCNRYIKFAPIIDRAELLECDFMATGHYAGVTKNESTGRYELLCGKDEQKDQSYFLYMLTQAELEKLKLPLYDYTKGEIREMAESAQLINARKPDSQDICFVPDGDCAGFIERYTGKKDIPGDFVNTSGEKIGTHKGITNFTIGQRRGLGVGFSKRMFVCDKDPVSGSVILGDNDDLFSDNLIMSDVNFISVESLEKPTKCRCKIRYRHKAAPATAYPLAEGKVKIVFDVPQRAITPGQAAVCYEDNKVLLGGTCEKER